jgi:glycoside hydrolase-like protein
MQSLWNGWAYQDAGVYIGGSNFNGVQPDLAWLRATYAQGWGVMSICVGRQDPCACYKTPSCHSACCPYPSVFSSNNDIARSQGEQEANDAVLKAQSLGFGFEIIYLDLEYYDHDVQNGACGESASSFVDG